MCICVFGSASQRPVTSASQWLTGAARALAGEATLQSLAAVEVSGVSVWRQREQSERPEGPWLPTFTDFTDVRNFVAGAVLRSARMRGFSTPDWIDNTQWTAESTTLVAPGVALRRTDSTLVAAAMPWDLGILPVGLGPEHVVIAARDAKDIRAEPDAMLDAYAHHVVAFTFEDARVRLFLNVPSLLPKAIEITRAHPYDTFWAPWGDVTHRVTFGMWNLEPGGFRYPRLWEFSTNGQPDGTVMITRVRMNPNVVQRDFEITEEVRQRVISTRRPVADAPFGSAQRPAYDLAPGIVKVPGSWDIVEVKQEDGTVILEGPLSSNYSAQVIADVQKRFGNGHVNAVITTSDAWPHIGGMREYVARAIPIYALDLNIPILSRLFAAKYQSFPDALARGPKQPALHAVSGRTTVGSGPNRIEIYPFRTATGERQMMVYWPAHHLLYTSDLFTIRPGLVFLPQQVSEAVDAVAREHLAVSTAFGMHYDALPWTTVVASAAPTHPPVR